MMSGAPIIAIIVSLLVVIISMSNWRYGLLCLIAVGVLQDVLRKLTPGVPAYYITWSMLMFGVVGIIAFSRNAIGGLGLLWFADARLRIAFYLYFALIALQLLHALLRWQSPVIPVLGLVFYVGPILALLLVVSFGKQERWVRRFIRTYLFIMVPVCLSVYLSFLTGDTFPVLRDVGSFLGNELIIYDVGTILYSYPGLLRVGEIAAFHAATCAAFLSLLLLDKNSVTMQRLGFVVLIILLVGAIALTGRRKMLMTLSIFWILQFFFLSYFRKGMSRQLVGVLLLGLGFSFAVGFMGEGGQSSLYLQRGVSVFASVDDRVDTALNLFTSAISRSGGLGLGAGVAAQGSRYAGIDNSLSVGGSSESGIGLIVVELGLPGLFIILWLGLHVLRVLRAKIKLIASMDERAFLYSVSFAALLVANLATFGVATQLYGDYFVLIVLGVIAGMLYVTIERALVKRELLERYAILSGYSLRQKQYRSKIEQ